MYPGSPCLPPRHHHRSRGHESDQSGDPENTVRLGVIEERTEEGRCDDSTEVESCRYEAEYLADLTRRRQRQNQHIAGWCQKFCV